MTLYDPDNEHHLRYLAYHRAGWTRDKERALQAQLARDGSKGEFGVRAVGMPELELLRLEARERGVLASFGAIDREIRRRQRLT